MFWSFATVPFSLTVTIFRRFLVNFDYYRFRAKTSYFLYSNEFLKYLITIDSVSEFCYSIFSHTGAKVYRIWSIQISKILGFRRSSKGYPYFTIRIIKRSGPLFYGPDRKIGTPGSKGFWRKEGELNPKLNPENLFPTKFMDSVVPKVPLV